MQNMRNGCNGAITIRLRHETPHEYNEIQGNVAVIKNKEKVKDIW